ncbi:UNVERIFIED_CONTAM: hypothetical protein NCL1_15848 [Trichonephila clavipes]
MRYFPELSLLGERSNNPEKKLFGRFGSRSGRRTAMSQLQRQMLRIQSSYVEAILDNVTCNFLKISISDKEVIHLS